MSLFAPIPLPVEESSAEALEWGRLLEIVAEFAHSGVARDWLLALQPSRDPVWIDEQHALAGEMRVLLEEGGAPPLSGLFDPTPLVYRARIAGASLEAEEIRDLLLLLETVTAWQDFLERPPEAVAGQLAGLAVLSRPAPGAQLKKLVRSLCSRMNPDGSLAEDASPALKRIRKEIERQQRAIEHSLRASLRRLSEAGEVQEDLITIRGERFVIPVKSEFKRWIAGVVHGASSSGQTVYLKPLETIEQNNELVRLLEEEQVEIRRIFLAMSQEIGAEANAILRGASSLARLDAASAAARFAADFNCVRPQLADPAEPLLLLEQARHPLLEKRLRGAAAHGSPLPEPETTPPRAPTAIVPLTLVLNGQQRQLIVSGPNTGGKTVVLKTTGLLGMMAQAGIPVPARKAVFPLFAAFLAEVGDAQSIEQNLSTFSAQVTHLNRFLRLADASSLVLLDELDSTTDPEEGAALAVAIASRFLERRAWCLISTHHTALKVYATEHAGVVNAAVGFDERTLQPTYQLRMGIPGASAGINIAQQLGLDRAVLEDARARLRTQAKDIAYFLDQLHAQVDAAARERSVLAQREREIAREKNRLESDGLKEWQAKARGFEQQYEALFRDLGRHIRETLAAVDDRAAQSKIMKDAERRVVRLRREFSEQFNAIGMLPDERDKGQPKAAPEVTLEISPGDMVKLKSVRGSGRVLRQLAGDTFEVAVGSMKMRVARREITQVEKAQELKRDAVSSPLAAARQRGISVSLSHPDSVPSEIKVIGYTVEEATAEVDRFLDQAFLAGRTRVRIVHGTGKGILRKALRAQLERHPHVAQVADASQSEGGAGATLVELRF